MFKETSKEIIEIVTVVQQVKRTTRKFLNNLFSCENLHLSPQKEVHEGADQHLWLVLSCLNVHHRTVNQLHQISEKTVRLFLKVFEVNWASGQQPGVRLADIKEKVPLSH
jgi:hypothetical protein